MTETTAPIVPNASTQEAQVNLGTSANAAAPLVGAVPPDASSPALEIYKPESFPEHLLGKTNQETIDKLNKAYSGARDALAKKGEIPKTPDAYIISSEGDVAAYGDLNQANLFKNLREVALKSELTPQQYNSFVQGLVNEFKAEGLLQSPEQIAENKQMLIPEGARHLSPPEQQAATQQRIQDNKALVETWASRGLPKAAASLLEAALSDAGGNQIVEFMHQQFRGVQPSLAGGTAAPMNAKDMWSDPRAIPSSDKFDPDYVRQIGVAYEKTV